jgi:alkylation response protein AidB-like acyl-CoA dehydrogenase
MSPPTDEQLTLAATVRAVVAKHAGPTAVRAAASSERGYDEKLWALLCNQIGVAALAVPEEYGGIGAGLVEANLVLTELGRALVPSPMLGSAVLAAHVLLESKDADACARLLPGIAEGTTIAAFCWAEASGWSTPGPLVESDGTLSGTAHYVLDGKSADVLIVAARASQGVTLFEVDPGQDGVVRRTSPGMDPTRPLTVVEFSEVDARPIAAADADRTLARVRDIACAALAAEQVGAAQGCLELTVDYTKSRVQFGRPIGSFQALKHRMADMYALVETARSAADAASASLDPADCAVAKVYCSEAFSQVAAEAIQLHGGIAITWEHDAQLYFKRAHGSSQLFGQPDEYVERFAAGQLAEQALT